MTTITKLPKFTTDIENKIVELIGDNQTPRSIIDIQKHYNLSFPFTVKRVRDSHQDGPTAFVGVSEITTIRTIKDFNSFLTNNTEQDGVGLIFFQDAECPDYILESF